MEECRQKAWSASCNADYISKHFDKMMGEYEKLKREDAEHDAEITALDAAPDYHSKDNREKRKALEGRRKIIERQLAYIKARADEAHAAIQQLYSTAETQLELAKHAEKWEWKEAQSATELGPEPVVG